MKESFLPQLEKSFCYRVESVFFARLALYFTYFFLWLFGNFVSFFPRNLIDFLIIILGFIFAQITYYYKTNKRISRWLNFFVLIFDIFANLFLARLGFLLSPLILIHPLFSACFLLLFHNIWILLVPFLILPLAMALTLITYPTANILELLGLVALNYGLDILVVFLINHSHGYEQKLAQEMVDIEKKLKELAILKERQRISKEFHDGLGANLTSIIMQCDYLNRTGFNLETLAQIKESAIESIDDMRRSIAFLNGHFDIVEQTKIMLERIQDRHRISTSYLGLEILEALNYEQQISLCRIIQEGLTNALKHAQASKISLIVQKTHNFIEIFITDNGIGFTNKKLGFGLKNMSERIEQLGGTFSFEPKSIGSEIYLQIPGS
jgi:two-component system sensor histidine kinase DegS